MQKKNFYYSVMVALVLAGAAFSLSSVGHPSAQADATTAAPNGTITVTGHGDEQVAPDMATIDAGIVTRGKDAKTAQSENDSTMRQMMAALEGAGIKGTDIHTQWYSIHPNYGQPNSNGNPSMDGFEADDNIEVAIHDLSRVGDIIDLLVKSGANQINNVNYSVSNPTQLQEQLYQQALTDAKAQATNIAQAIGATISGVASVDTTSSSGGPIYFGASAAQGSASAPISPGTQDISTAVKVVYTINASSASTK